MPWVLCMEPFENALFNFNLNFFIEKTGILRVKAWRKRQIIIFFLLLSIKKKLKECKPVVEEHAYNSSTEGLRKRTVI